MSKPTLLFLRSFGDFTIAIAVLRKSLQPLPFRLVASVHLQPLYHDLKASLSDLDLDIEFVDFGIRNKIFGFFTNRHSIEPHSITELWQLSRFMKDQSSHDPFIFEQRKKLWFIAPFVGFGRDCIHASGNVYDSYCRRLHVDATELRFDLPVKDKKKILILPESRKPDKALTQQFVDKQCREWLDQGHDVTTAFFKNVSWSVAGKTTTHLAFSELIALIREADEVVTADSLPAHLSQLLEQPHHIVYRKQPDAQWLTPFARQHQSFSTCS